MTEKKKTERQGLIKKGGLALTELALPFPLTAYSNYYKTTSDVLTRNEDTLRIRGINYDTGVNYDQTVWSRDFWHPEAVEHDMKIIALELGCTAVSIFGTKHERLREAAELALKQGLDVWLQPRLIEGTQAATLKHLVETAIIAEELRSQYENKITLNVGCELSLFMKGILPGKNFFGRMRGLMVYWIVMPIFNRKLNKYFRTACESARMHFNGPLVYSAGEWEGVDWTLFDYVGVDYYRERLNASTYTNGLRKLKSYHKPVIITEFGCCSFKGAELKGGGGFMIVDWRKDSPTVKPGYVRDERVQADYIKSLVELYREEQIDGAFVYAFSEPRNLHTDNSLTDLDMASYGVVKITLKETAENPEVWKTKQAFGSLAKLYRGKLLE